MTNEELLQEFYARFKGRDSEGMARCYHREIEFSDPVFPKLRGREVSAMWHMLVARGKETKIEITSIQASGDKGSASWEARYPYGPKRRPVHNVVRSEFEFRDGKIFRQKDEFDLPLWLSMALGPVGRVLGWTSLLQGKVRRLADRGLREYLEAHPPKP